MSPASITVHLCTSAHRIFTFLYLLPAYRDHRHIPSFPTRRSSDLGDPLEPVEGELLLHATVSSDSPRSEEHTSELQSHSDLVCRLLLEKKKKTSIFTGS